MTKKSILIATVVLLTLAMTTLWAQGAVEYMEANPDTTLIMLSGKRLVVREDRRTIMNSIIEYRRQIGAFKNEE